MRTSLVALACLCSACFNPDGPLVDLTLSTSLPEDDDDDDEGPPEPATDTPTPPATTSSDDATTTPDPMIDPTSGDESTTLAADESTTTTPIDDTTTTTSADDTTTTPADATTTTSSTSDPCEDGGEACGVRRVFVTSTTYTGDLGGALDADGECTAVAASAGLPGSFRAWISDAGTSPAARLDTSFAGVYQRTDGQPIAVGWSDLTDGALMHPIALDEFGADVFASPYAWTGTTADGDPIASHCTGWSTTSAAVSGVVGDIHATDDGWTDLDLRTCNLAFRLYCFEDP